MADEFPLALNSMWFYNVSLRTVLCYIHIVEYSRGVRRTRCTPTPLLCLVVSSFSMVFIGFRATSGETLKAYAFASSLPFMFEGRKSVFFQAMNGNFEGLGS